ILFTMHNYRMEGFEPTACYVVPTNALINQVNKKLKQRRDFSYKRLNEIEGISTAKPQGAFYIFPKIEAMDKGIWKTDKDFVLDLLKEVHVLVVNGSGFCSIYGKNHFRAVILPTMEMLEEAFDKIEYFMKKRLSGK
ncbi:MAG: aminotransferase class I/II-fold pyridoxal phosphate-dependent enzyme, partial [Candidatus Thermoplasmatota archaeon]|nr:aminotransferase class I/II-fold pyridoxal phosphate-dependent enzyme [Candidatus Thermoplasmatota archaeon]